MCWARVVRFETCEKLWTGVYIRRPDNETSGWNGDGGDGRPALQRYRRNGRISVSLKESHLKLECPHGHVNRIIPRAGVIEANLIVTSGNREVEKHSRTVGYPCQKRLWRITNRALIAARPDKRAWLIVHCRSSRSSETQACNLTNLDQMMGAIWGRVEVESEEMRV